MRFGVSFILLIAFVLLGFEAQSFAYEPVIGVVMDRTTTRVASEETVRGLEAGAAYLLKRHGLKLRLRIEDSGPHASGTAQLTNKFIDEKVDLIIGEIASSKSEVAAQAAELRKTVMITPYATASSITKNRKFVFRTCASHQVQVENLRSYFVSRGAKRIATIYDLGQLYSVDLAKALEDSLVNKTGVKSKLEGVLFPSNNVGASIQSVIKFDPEYVYLPVYEEAAARLVSQFYSSEVESKNLPILIGGDGWQIGDLYRAVVLSKFPSAKVRFVTHHNPRGSSQIQKEFEDLYRQKFGVRPETSGSYLAFDTMLLIGEIFKDKKKLQSEQIRELLSNSVQVSGVTGFIKFSGQNDPLRKKLFINEYSGSGLLSVSELNL